MKRNLIIGLAIVAIFVCGALIGSPLMAMAEQYGFWNGSIAVATTESLVVKSGDTVLDSPYTFLPVELKTGDTKVYTITVQNTGTATYTVKPTAVSAYPDYVTAVWSYSGSPDGQSIASGASATFVLTLTALQASPNVSIAVGFTRE